MAVESIAIPRPHDPGSPSQNAGDVSRETSTPREPCPHATAEELRSMLDVLLAASNSDVELFEGTLDRYAESMIQKVDIVCRWFDGDGVERIMAGPEDKGARILDLCCEIKEAALENHTTVEDHRIEDAADTIVSMIGAPLPAYRTALEMLHAARAACEMLTARQVAERMRAFEWNVSENLGADPHEGGFTVTKTWTLKGIQHHLATEEFFGRFLYSEDGDERQPEDLAT